MANCKFGLNDHKPFLGKEKYYYHHQGYKHKNNLSKHNISQKFVFSIKKRNILILMTMELVDMTMELVDIHMTIEEQIKKF